MAKQLIGCVFCVAELSLLLLPSEVLYESSGRMKLGYIFRGLDAIFGEPFARTLIASPVFALAFIFYRKAYPMRTRKR